MTNYVSLKTVLDKVMIHPLLVDLSFETAVLYTLEFLRIVGVPRIFEDRFKTLEVKDYRAVLPCDLLDIIQVKEHCSAYALRATTDTFYQDDRGPAPYEYTFKVQGDILYTNMKEGALDIAYKAIVTDEEGYPMIPDDSTFIRALEQYIKKQWFTILFDMGRIQPAVLQNAQQEYAFYVAQAQNKLVMPTLSEMESLSNMWTSLLHKTNEFKTGFKTTGAKELLKVQ
jgi:hypothetical protein|nr:MAG TPA: hypothetical protein [Crassvirales sp.]